MRRRQLVSFAIAAIAAAVAVFWIATAPRHIDRRDLDGLVGDPARGAQLFDLGGCAACHAPAGSKDADRLVLRGGVALASPFGTFYAPNISPDPAHGIGGWTLAEFVDAMRYGTAPDGGHYYPAFPYTSYGRVPLGDLADLKAFLDTLPASDVASLPHDVPFPFNIRRSLGGWKLLFLSSAPVVPEAGLSAQALRGRAMVEGLGHCGECHTPRGALGNLDYSRWMQGAPNPTGKGKIPALAGHDWSAGDIAEYLKSGFTPEFDSAGGAMAEVVENTARLSDDDRAAIAAYLKALPAPTK